MGTPFTFSPQEIVELPPVSNKLFQIRPSY